MQFYDDFIPFHLFALLFSHLHTMDCKPRASVQFFMTDVALEMFRLLMLNENLFIIKISVTVPEIITV